MPNRKNLPLLEGMLPRPRIHSLIKEGFRSPLLVLLAAPGYGKTQAMAEYLSKNEAAVVWVRLSRLDNLPSHFWEHLRLALKSETPELFELLKTQEFPNTLIKFDAFFQALSKYLSTQKKVVWVFDDFGEINEGQIKDFIKTLVDIDWDNFRIALISNALGATESIAYFTNRQSLILGKDLRFTKEEIVALYNMHNIPLSEEEFDNIERYTEGWPFPLHLLSLQQGQIYHLINPDGQLTHQAISHLFEARFFSAYPKHQQKLFVELSLLDFFSREIAAEIYEGNQADLNGLLNLTFINNEPVTGRLFFHRLYRLFLQQKKHILSPGQEQRLFEKSAAHHASRGHSLEAIGYYRKAGNHPEMLNVITNSALSQFGTTEKDAAYYLEHIDLLTPEELENNPVADGVRALIYMNTLRLDEAEAVLSDLEQRMLKAATEDALSFLGELYVLHGFVYMMRGREDFVDYFEKANERLPNGSSFENQNPFRIHNNHCFFLPDVNPGAKERIGRVVHKGVGLISKISPGALSGMQHLFSAEGAYFSCRFQEARQHAYRAIYDAELKGNYDIVCNSHVLLARIALLQGDFDELSAQIQTIKEYAKSHNFNVISEIRDTAIAWYCLQMHDHKRIPSYIFKMNNAEPPVIASGRLLLVYANYLLETEGYSQLIGLMEHHNQRLSSGAIRPDQISVNLFLAVAYNNIGNPAAATKSLFAAYEMAHGNQLTAFFIEFTDYMSALINQAKEQSIFEFDSEWLDFVKQESERCSEQLAAMRVVYKQKNPQKPAQQSPLTKREVEVLQALSLGLTREEIASKQYVSINTVKTFIKSIYNKLSASNRAEAVSIAISRGYIDAHVL